MARRLLTALCGVLLPVFLCAGAEAATHRHHGHAGHVQTATYRAGHGKAHVRHVSSHRAPRHTVITRGS